MNMYFYYLFILNVHHLQSSFFCNLSVKTAVSSLSRLSSYFVLHHLYCRLFPSKNRGPMYLLPFFNFLIKMFWFSFVWVFFFSNYEVVVAHRLGLKVHLQCYLHSCEKGFIELDGVLWKSNYPLTVSIEGNQPGSANHQWVWALLWKQKF